MVRNIIKVTVYIQEFSQLDRVLDEIAKIVKRYPYVSVSIEVGKN